MFKCLLFKVFFFLFYCGVAMLFGNFHLVINTKYTTCFCVHRWPLHGRREKFLQVVFLTLRPGTGRRGETTWRDSRNRRSCVPQASSDQRPGRSAASSSSFSSNRSPMRSSARCVGGEHRLLSTGYIGCLKVNMDGSQRDHQT